MLIDAPDNPEKARKMLIRAYRRICKLAELKVVVDTQETVKQAAAIARRAVHDILLMEYIAGECQVCRQLSRR